MLLTPKENWTTGAYARNELNRAVLTSDPTACKFCLVGGLRRVASAIDLNNALYPVMLDAVSDQIDQGYHGQASIIKFNDSMGHSEVLNMLDNTIHNVRRRK